VLKYVERPIICQRLLRWSNGMQSRVIGCTNWYNSFSERAFFRDSNYWKGLVTKDDYDKFQTEV